jgi:hypothetical protein
MAGGASWSGTGARATREVGTPHAADEGHGAWTSPRHQSPRPSAPAVAATDNGRQARDAAVGRARAKAPSVLLGCGLRRREAAVLATAVSSGEMAGCASWSSTGAGATRVELGVAHAADERHGLGHRLVTDRPRPSARRRSRRRTTGGRRGKLLRVSRVKAPAALKATPGTPATRISANLSARWRT